MPIATLPKPAKSSAAGQYLGFSLQQVRLCHYLLASPDDHIVSLELIDDVGVHRPDGTAFFEQAKSSISGNPATNKADDLWKTFANWAETCALLQINPSQSQFHYYVSTGKPGSLIMEISKATTPCESVVALAKIKKFCAGLEAGVGCEPQLTKFLSAGDSTCCAIIERCTFENQVDPVDAIRSHLKVFPSAVLDDLCAAAIGQARDKIDELIRTKQTPAILSSEFRKRFWAFVHRHSFANVLNPAADEPDQQTIDATILGEPLFVRQLRAVEASRTLIAGAVSDYMRTTADKVKWANDALVFEDSFTELDGQLVRRHMLVCEEIDILHPALAVNPRGQRVYLECAKTDMPLEGRALPSYFITGSFNCLAQIRRVGWHIDYLTLFPAE
ncbi:hypothetical protein HFN98_06900 [Rhizobium laguerreae]|uniref:ABC-three component system protein n=1 Tax=Rhizobium laguerreae TaxID=1076926 RepID=UPI001C91EF84|nr:ABC-three component system protein [Rhizobium laguerreae]MBY3330376.1 hypothetical protein [Rhizobium laguerreae]